MTNTSQSLNESLIGQLIDVGGYGLHIYCIGEGSPTVVMDSGGGATLEAWRLVQPEVAKFTRACTYDRAGLGLSESSPTPRTIQHMTKELHTLLKKVGIESPYVLVGHSLGGFIVRLFASQYPDEVVGMVLVDAGHEDYVTRHLALLSSEEKEAFLKQWGEFLEKLPERVQLEAKADENRAQLFAANPLPPNLPLIVITHGVPDPNMFAGIPADKIGQAEQLWMELQKDLASLVLNSKHIIAEQSGHDIPKEQPMLVTDVIRQVVESARKELLKP
jgi:pimeloyl-ACP methyl ester carboxylesterase